MTKTEFRSYLAQEILNPALSYAITDMEKLLAGIEEQADCKDVCEFIKFYTNQFIRIGLEALVWDDASKRAAHEKAARDCIPRYCRVIGFEIDPYDINDSEIEDRIDEVLGEKLELDELREGCGPLHSVKMAKTFQSIDEVGVYRKAKDLELRLLGDALATVSEDRGLILDTRYGFHRLDDPRLSFAQEQEAEWCVATKKNGDPMHYEIVFMPHDKREEIETLYELQS